MAACCGNIDTTIALEHIGLPPCRINGSNEGEKIFNEVLVNESLQHHYNRITLVLTTKRSDSEVFLAL